MTDMFAPLFMASIIRPASSSAGLANTSSVLQRSSMSFAPASRPRTSMPQTAAAIRPTGHSSEKRPPTPSGM